jgi:hypothetical protein
MYYDGNPDHRYSFAARPLASDFYSRTLQPLTGKIFDLLDLSRQPGIVFDHLLFVVDRTTIPLSNGA